MLVQLYSEIDHLHLSSEAQCVSHLLPLGDCHKVLTSMGGTVPCCSFDNYRVALATQGDNIISTVRELVCLSIRLSLPVKGACLCVCNLGNVYIY